jgi:hypothetical protein
MPMVRPPKGSVYRTHFKFRGSGRNFLADFLDGSIQEIRKKVADIDEAEKVAIRAHEILSDFEFEVDAPQPDEASAPFGVQSFRCAP